MKKYFGLIGEHLLHSYSAIIHSELGQTEYQHTELKKDELEDFFKGVKIGGINITIPYKKDVFPFCDELSSEAREIGAVNTIYLDGDKVIGHNTDADGFLFMAENAGITLKDKKVLVL
ncbi:MAG: hypothetical protein IIV81_02760, partial [Clostridia bacterium]|nr:hypothetical protein [Clostridia bacterium]